MYQEEHPEFTAPSSDAVLWRYLDFTKFVSLLDGSALFFARTHTLDDPFEGSVTTVNEVVRKTLYPTMYPEAPGLGEAVIDARRRFPQYVLVNCWHSSEHESAAMWKLYAAQAGVAIKTQFQSLADSITDDNAVYIGKINFVD